MKAAAMDRELYLLRHAETEANARGILQGRLDYPLSSRGLRQAAALGPVLVGLEFDLLLRSPARRVAATLAPARELGLPEAAIRDDLQEIDLGSLSGISGEEFAARFAAEIDLEEYRRGEYRFGDGESRRELYDRAAGVWRSLERLEFRRGLLAAHGGLLSQLLAVALGIPNDGRVRFRLDNACLSRLLWHDGRSFLSSFNDAAHLPDGHRSPPFTPRLGRGA
jgi:broad specificity phosphatase PhoE